MSPWNAAANRSIVHHQMIHELIWSSSGMILKGKTKELGEKSVPVPLCPPQIPHGLLWAQTQASAVNCLSYGMASSHGYAMMTLKLFCDAILTSQITVHSWDDDH
jgi:hypothetical protein